MGKHIPANHARHMREWRAKQKAAGITVNLRCNFDGTGDLVPNPEYQRRYRLANRAKRRGQYQRLSPSAKANLVKGNRRYRQRVKDEAYALLGGYRCACCGETEPAFLSIDHVFGNGKIERKTIPHQTSFYISLRKRNDLSGYQVLCMNCNKGRYLNGGLCPHKYREQGTTCEMGAEI
jgi:hypothetical protein